MGTVLLRCGAAAALVSLGASVAGAATRSAAEQAKIEALLERVRDSPAVFIRNGSEYDGKRAASHLRTKLFFAGDRVQTARDFVVGVASRSEESGQPYRVRFEDGRIQDLGAWLLEALAALEKPPTPPPTVRRPSATPGARGSERG